jgi:hypothetical protein
MDNTTTQNAPYLQSFDALKECVLQSGYTENFVYGNSGYISLSDSRRYELNQVKVVSMIRFQGNDSSKERAELYIVETPDGMKGMFEKKESTD